MIRHRQAAAILAVILIVLSACTTLSPGGAQPSASLTPALPIDTSSPIPKEMPSPTATLPPEQATSTAQAAIIGTHVAALNQSLTFQAEIDSGTLQPDAAVSTMAALMAGNDDNSLSMTAAAIWITSQPTLNPEVLKLQDQCDQPTTIAGAPTYIAGPGLHTADIEGALGTASSDSSDWQNTFPKEWQPKDINELPELVVCVKQDDIVYERCLYGPPGSSQATHELDRMARNVTIRIVTAAEGREVSRKYYPGGTPPICDNPQFGSETFMQWYGDYASFDDARGWLESMINPQP